MVGEDNWLQSTSWWRIRAALGRLPVIAKDSQYAYKVNRLKLMHRTWGVSICTLADEPIAEDGWR